ncbi:phage virion morphogenesis protein [Chachezhania sediminis]|uniref:phage virion morphogenesis protein n=1 Tax=Chachezhania sediminis TaxID=2599291 RepID=UPI00131C4900|nr:phage virion morphogenesis protein [Chachezhania sediminis]
MITVEINDAQVRQALDEIARALTDLTPAMQDIGEYLTETTKERFRKGVSPEGTPWAPKSQATIDAYVARKDKVDFRPLHGPSGRLSSEISYQAGPSQVEIGSNLIYAAVQHFGAEAGQFGARIGTDKRGRFYFMPIPWGDIPARPFLGLSAEDRTGVLEILEEYVTGAQE